MKKFAIVFALALAACSISHKDESNKVNGKDSNDFYKQFTVDEAAMTCKPGVSIVEWPTLQSYMPSRVGLTMMLKSDGTFQANSSDRVTPNWSGTWKVSGVSIVLNDIVSGTGGEMTLNGVTSASVTFSFPKDNTAIPEILRGETVMLLKDTASRRCN